MNVNQIINEYESRDGQSAGSVTMSMADKKRKPRVLNTILVMIFGAALGLISKILDETAVSELPMILEYFDIRNFLGRFAVWIFIAVCIAVYSSSAKRAALNVGVFFVGMVSFYYLYSKFVAGFFPKSYALIWFVIAALSPVPAYFCWYAKREGKTAVILSGGITGVLLSQAIFFLQGIRIAHLTEVMVWAVSLWVLRRKPKEFAAMMGISLVVAVAEQIFIPYWG